MNQQVLLIGATGKLGGHFIDALLAGGHDVTALVRNAGGNAPGRRARLESLRARGVILVEGDLNDVASLERATRTADAVVSCVDHRPDNLKAQVNLAGAISGAYRVRRVMPSQFGIDSRLYGPLRVGHGDIKRQLQTVFLEAGVPVTFVHNNGMARDWVLSLGQLGLERPPAEAVEIYGTGEVAFNTVAASDIARYAVRALFDPSAGNRHVLIAPPDNRLTQNQLVALWEAMAGVSLRREMVSAEALDARIDALAEDVAARPRLAMAQLVRAAWIDGLGDGRRLPDVPELTSRYPDLSYIRTSEYLARYANAQSEMSL